MITGEIPWNGYWRRTGRQVFAYPLQTVFAKSIDEANAIARAHGDPYDGMEYVDVCLDSIAAQRRLGTFGTGSRLP